VTGKMVAKHDAPKVGAIPWLLVTVTGHKGSGALESVTTIHRVNTDGGVADAAKICDASRTGRRVKVRIRRIIIFMRRVVRNRAYE